MNPNVQMIKQMFEDMPTQQIEQFLAESNNSAEAAIDAILVWKEKHPSPMPERRIPANGNGGNTTPVAASPPSMIGSWIPAAPIVPAGTPTFGTSPVPAAHSGHEDPSGSQRNTNTGLEDARNKSLKLTRHIEESIASIRQIERDPEKRFLAIVRLLREQAEQTTVLNFSLEMLKEENFKQKDREAKANSDLMNKLKIAEANLAQGLKQFAEKERDITAAAALMNKQLSVQAESHRKEKETLLVMLCTRTYTHTHAYTLRCVSRADS
jgi:hypothetical protein